MKFQVIVAVIAAITFVMIIAFISISYGMTVSAIFSYLVVMNEFVGERSTSIEKEKENEKENF